MWPGYDFTLLPFHDNPQQIRFMPLDAHCTTVMTGRSLTARDMKQDLLGHAETFDTADIVVVDDKHTPGVTTGDVSSV